MQRSLSCRRLAVVVLLLLSAPGCARRLYEGPARPRADVAIIHVGDATVRSVDGRFDFGIALGSRSFEVVPGPHRIVFGFERTARSVGLRDIPAQSGRGNCTIDFYAEGGKEYSLDARPIGTDWTMRKWDGQWEGWIRDPASDSDDDMVAHCTPGQPAPSAVARPQAESPPAAVAAGSPVLEAAPPAPATAPLAEAVVSPPVVAAGAASVVNEEAAEVQQISSVRVATWNLRGLAPDRDFATLARVVDESFDLVAITEAASVTSGDRGARRLHAALGDGWLWISGLAATDGAADRGTAIFYREAVARVCDDWPGARPVIAPGADRFGEPPMYTCFEVGGDGEEWLLAAYRAADGGGDLDVVAAEVRQLDRALAVMRQSRPQATRAIVGGQFHLTASELSSVLSMQVRSRGTGSALDLVGEPIPGVRDHVVVSGGAPAEAPEATLDIREMLASPSQFRARVSDHLPVVVELPLD